MEADGQQQHGNIHGNLLRLRDGRSVAIYLRAGVVSVVEFHGVRGRLLGLAEWHTLHARKVAHAQRRGEVEILSPIPANVVDRVEALHGRLGELNDNPFKRKAVGLSSVFARVTSHLVPDPAIAGSRLLGAGAFRVD